MDHAVEGDPGHAVGADPGPLDDLVADCADLSRQLLVLRTPLPVQRSVVTIPDGAVTLVAGLGDYGD